MWESGSVGKHGECLLFPFILFSSFIWLLTAFLLLLRCSKGRFSWALVLSQHQHPFASDGPLQYGVNAAAPSSTRGLLPRGPSVRLRCDPPPSLLFPSVCVHVWIHVHSSWLSLSTAPPSWWPTWGHVHSALPTPSHTSLTHEVNIRACGTDPGETRG